MMQQMMQPQMPGNSGLMYGARPPSRSLPSSGPSSPQSISETGSGGQLTALQAAALRANGKRLTFVL